MTDSDGPVGPDARFGAAVRQAREARGWSQDLLAKKLGEQIGLHLGGQSGIVRIERGIRPTRLSEVVAIAKFLGLDLAKLLSPEIGVFDQSPTSDEITQAVREREAVLAELTMLDSERAHVTSQLDRLQERLASLLTARQAARSRWEALNAALHQVDRTQMHITDPDEAEQERWHRYGQH